MAHAHCMRDTQGNKRTLRICNTYCFSFATMVARTHLNVTLYVRNCLSCLFLSLLSSHFVSSHFLVIYFLPFVFVSSLIHVFYFITLHESGISFSWLVYGLHNQAVGGSSPSKDRLLQSDQSGFKPHSDF
jgi:hypothetical protein